MKNSFSENIIGNVLAVLATVSNCTKLDFNIFAEIKKFGGLPHDRNLFQKKWNNLYKRFGATNVGALLQ